MIPKPYDSPIVDYAAPGNLEAILGLKSGALVGRLVQVKAMHNRLDAKLNETLGPIEDLDQDKDPIAVKLLESDLEMLQNLSRVIAVLSQGSLLLISTDGAVLRLATAFSGSPEVLAAIRDSKPVDLTVLPAEGPITEPRLSEYARDAMRFLLGLLPKGARSRLALRFAEGSLPSAIQIDNTKEREAFTQTLELAFSLIPERVDETNQDD